MNRLGAGLAAVAITAGSAAAGLALGVFTTGGMWVGADRFWVTDSGTGMTVADGGPGGGEWLPDDRPALSNQPLEYRCTGCGLSLPERLSRQYADSYAVGSYAVDYREPSQSTGERDYPPQEESLEAQPRDRPSNPSPESTAPRPVGGEALPGERGGARFAPVSARPLSAQITMPAVSLPPKPTRALRSLSPPTSLLSPSPKPPPSRPIEPAREGQGTISR